MAMAEARLNTWMREHGIARLTSEPDAEILNTLCFEAEGTDGISVYARMTPRSFSDPKSAEFLLNHLAELMAVKRGDADG